MLAIAFAFVFKKILNIGNALQIFFISLQIKS